MLIPFCFETIPSCLSQIVFPLCSEHNTAADYCLNLQGKATIPATSICTVPARQVTHEHTPVLPEVLLKPSF